MSGVSDAKGRTKTQHSDRVDGPRALSAAAFLRLELVVLWPWLV